MTASSDDKDTNLTPDEIRRRREAQVSWFGPEYPITSEPEDESSDDKDTVRVVAAALNLVRSCASARDTFVLTDHDGHLRSINDGHLAILYDAVQAWMRASESSDREDVDES